MSQPDRHRRAPDRSRSAPAQPHPATDAASGVGLAASDRRHADTLSAALHLHHAGRLGEAEALYRKIVAATPDHADAWHLLGLVAHRAGEFEPAVQRIMRAIECRPQALYFFNLGNVMAAHHRHAAAAECFRQAIALQPDYADAHNNLGSALRALKQREAALDAYCKVIELRPDSAPGYNNLANVLLDLGELDAALEAYRRALALAPDLTEPRSNLLFALNYADDTTPERYLAEAVEYGERVARAATPWTDWLGDLSASARRPLRVGIVSGDLKMHPVGYFLESVARELDPQRIELVAYSTRNLLEDALTRRIKPHFSAWHSLAGVSDRDAATLIRSHRIDVLVDASGHTRHNRLPLFAWRPAPVQASWPGYFASTGVRAIDYVLGDACVLPDGDAPQFVERPWRLPGCYLCFTPPTDDVAIGPPPTRRVGCATFGYFGKLTKMTDRVVAVWARILGALPDARLMLKSEQLDSAAVRARTVERFRAHGVDDERLMLEGASARAEYLDAYNRVDVMLSPFPYPGGTTTAESLWMGVPVVCRRGDRFLSRIGESILHATDLADWIADGDDAYVAKALAIASDADALDAWRRTLRARLVASPLCDAQRFARELEAAFGAMWRERVGEMADVSER